VTYDAYVMQADTITDITTGESWQATPLQARALHYRDKGYDLLLLTDTEAHLTSTMLRGWKSILLTFLLSFLLPGVGLVLWAIWLFCIRTESILLLWTHEGELVERKKSLLGSM
jgi:hypothetical protein